MNNNYTKKKKNINEEETIQNQNLHVFHLQTKFLYNFLIYVYACVSLLFIVA